jgi:hypothetical protein
MKQNQMGTLAPYSITSSVRQGGKPSLKWTPSLLSSRHVTLQVLGG